MPKISTSSFNSDHFSPSKRLDLFRDMTSSVYDTELVEMQPNFQVSTHGYMVNPFMFHEFSCNQLRFRRTEKHIHGQGNDFLVLQAQLSGEEFLQTPNGFVRLSPGKIYLRDWAYPFESEAHDLHIFGVVIPRRLIHFHNQFNAQSSILSWSLTEPQGQTLWYLWRNMFEQFACLD